MNKLILLFFLCGSNSTNYQIKIQDSEIKHYYIDFAWTVWGVLSSPNGWGQAGVNFCPFGEPQFDIILATPDTVDELCAPLNTGGKVSCANRKEVVINFKRWKDGDSSWSSLEDYRRYVVNHEVGHALGMLHRKECTKDGIAPLMMQQSQRNLRCKPNSYPTDKEIKSLKRWRNKRWK
jgi:hypothetical protein